MKTTIEISDPLLREAKRVAQQAGITLRELVETGLRRVLDERKQATKPFVLRDCSVGGQGLDPRVRPGDWAQMRELIYGDTDDFDEIDRRLAEQAEYEKERERKDKKR